MWWCNRWHYSWRCDILHSSDRVWTVCLLVPNVPSVDVCVCFQEFHYRPRGSDTCLPCDCYPVGSFSRSCDAETGQCQCRPGVIGRQCNTCDNPFAEVTNSGCDGEEDRLLFLSWFFKSTFSVIVSSYVCLLNYAIDNQDQLWPGNYLIK